MRKDERSACSNWRLASAVRPSGVIGSRSGTIGEASKPMEIEAPDVESGVAQLVAPRASIEAMGDGQGGREGAAVHVQNDAAGRDALSWRHMPQEQVQAGARAGDVDVGLAWIEFRAGIIGRFPG